MSEPIKCFLITPTGRVERRLRRYHYDDSHARDCTVCKHGYHQESVPIGVFPATKTEGGYLSSPEAKEYRGDPRWPQAAPCGYVFTDDDEWQVNDEEIYVDVEGKEFKLDDPVPGMMWEAWWLSDHWKGPDGKSYVVITPDGWTWQIDGPCSNCTRVGEDHQCWCRHGGAPNFTVDKNCNTCKAGAGSIQTPKWHGFLTNGFLQENR